MPTTTIATGGEDALEASSVEADAMFNYLPLLLKTEVDRGSPELIVRQSVVFRRVWKE